jgi:hypothetical protein
MSVATAHFEFIVRIFDKALADFRQALTLEPENQVAADNVRALGDLLPGGAKQAR